MLMLGIVEETFCMPSVCSAVELWTLPANAMDDAARGRMGFRQCSGEIFHAQLHGGKLWLKRFSDESHWIGVGGVAFGQNPRNEEQ